MNEGEANEGKADDGKEDGNDGQCGGGTKRFGGPRPLFVRDPRSAPRSGVPLVGRRLPNIPESDGTFSSDEGAAGGLFKITLISESIVFLRNFKFLSVSWDASSHQLW